MARFQSTGESEFVAAIGVTEEVEQPPKNVLSVDRSQVNTSLPTRSLVTTGPGWSDRDGLPAETAPYDLLFADRDSDSDFQDAADDFFTRLGETADDRLHD